MPMFHNKLIATGIAGVLSLGILGGSVFALSQTSDSPGSADTATTAQAAGTPAPKSGPGRHGLKGEFKAGIEDILKATGLTKEQLAQGRKDGKSINQILRDNRKDPAAVQTQVLAAITTKVNEAVKNGKLTQDQATKVLDKLKTELPAFMDKTPKPHTGANGTPGARHAGGSLKGPGELGAAATALGLTPQQLMQELMVGGKSIADVAKAHNVPVDTVINAMVAEAAKHIDDAVTNNHLDATKAAELKSHLKDEITKLVNRAMPKFAGGANPRGPRHAPAAPQTN